jgi:hypothetical protein
LPPSVPLPEGPLPETAAAGISGIPLGDGAGAAVGENTVGGSPGVGWPVMASSACTRV